MGKLCSKSSSKPLLITRRETRKGMVKSQGPAHGQFLVRPLMDQHFNTRLNISQVVFINNQHGKQRNTQLADGTEMGVVADILRFITYCLALVRLQLEYFVHSLSDTMEWVQHSQGVRGLEHRIWVYLTSGIHEHGSTCTWQHLSQYFSSQSVFSLLNMIMSGCELF